MNADVRADDDPYRRNIATVLARYPRFENEVMGRYEPSPRLIPVRAACGAVTARYEGRLLHSSRNPADEARRTVALHASNGIAACVCLGFGLGYYVEATAIHYPGVPIIVVEPDVPAFLAALRARDVTAVLREDRMSLLLGVEPDEVADALAVVPPGNLHIVAPQSLYSCNAEYFDRVQERLRRVASRREINRNTLVRFGARWIRNLASNLKVIERSEGVSRLENRFADTPALVLAAGPTLDAVLPRLADLALRTVVIAVDTSLRACLDAGVVPDLLVVVDPQYWNTRHLDRCDTSQTVLVSESSTYPSVFRKTYRATLLCSSLFPLGSYIEKSIGAFGTLGAGGSVATTAWDLARFMGCPVIYMAGLDLGYPENRTHFRGSVFEERAHILSRRRLPAETSAFLALRDAAPYLVPANTGGEVLTDRRLIVYKWWFETQLRAGPGVETKSISGGGVRIDGIKAASLADVVRRPQIRSTVERRLSEALAEEHVLDRRSRSERFHAAIDRLDSELERLARIAARAVALVAELRSDPGAPDTLRALDSIDHAIASSGGKDIAGFLMQRIIDEVSFDGAGGAGGSRPSDVLDRSERLYRSIRESAMFHIEELRRGRRLMHQGKARPSRHSRGREKTLPPRRCVD